MMKEFNFGSYIRINYEDSMDTLNITNTFCKDLSGLKFALSELLAHYDKLACSIHNNSMVMESLVHLYASLNAFRIELIAIMAKSELISIVTDEAAIIFAQILNFDYVDNVDFSKYEIEE